jgi:plastocyanin
MSGGWRRAGAAVLRAAGIAAAAAAGAGTLAADRRPATHTVTIDATSYRPARLTVRPGDTVVWVNEDVIPHTATADGGRFDSDVLVAGASWRFTVPTTGTTAYACRFHPTMTGRLVAH